MDSKFLIDAELLNAFQGEPPVVEVNSANLKELRKFTLQMMSSFEAQDPSLVTVTRQVVELPHHSFPVPVIIYRPNGGKPVKPGILHIHGGGFVLGDAAMMENYCRKMASDLQSVVVSVDYRLAPETSFPGGLEDCYATLLWMSKKHAELQIDPARIAITGESGGGGLAAQLSFLVRDRKEVQIQFQFLTYAMLDDRTGSSQDPGEYLGQYFWVRSSNRFAWGAYLNPSPASASVPHPAVPARIENLQGLPPTVIMVGALDLFATENIQFAERLVRQGIPTEMHLYPGAVHGFDYVVGTNLSRKFFEERKAVFSRFFG